MTHYTTDGFDMYIAPIETPSGNAVSWEAAYKGLSRKYDEAAAVFVNVSHRNHAERDRMASMLRRLEWTDHGLCPVCYGVDPTRVTNSPKGHKPTCELATLLRELP